MSGSLKIKGFAQGGRQHDNITDRGAETIDIDDDEFYAPNDSLDPLPPPIKHEAQDIKPRFGDSGIAVRLPSGINGYEKDPQDYVQMESLGLPTNFALPGRRPEMGRKGEKKTYYCEFCQIELNSEDTMNSHVKGVKHMKKMATLANANKSVVQIANPKPLPKKIPIRLFEKLRDTNDPVVGLKKVTEIIACSNPEMEPYYECHLCGSQGEANGMFNHLLGRPHREKFLQDKFPHNEKYLQMSRKDMLREIYEFRENDIINECIKTIYSDEQYPWTAGKAPWSIEQGGTGYVPTFARCNQTERPDVGGRLLAPPRVEEKVVLKASLDPEDIKEIRSEDELRNMFCLMAAMSEKIIQYQRAKCSGEDASKAEMLCGAVNAASKMWSLVPVPGGSADLSAPSTSRDRRGSGTPLSPARGPSTSRASPIRTPPPARYSVKSERRSPSHHRSPPYQRPEHHGRDRRSSPQRRHERRGSWRPRSPRSHSPEYERGYRR